MLLRISSEISGRLAATSAQSAAEPLPGALRQPGSQLVCAATARRDGHDVVAGDRQDVAGLLLLEVGARRPVVAVASSAVTQPNGIPAASARAIICFRSCGFVANPVSPGTFAPSSRSRSPVQERGR